MLCGISRLSIRSILATATFFATAVGVVQYTGTPGPSVPPSTNFGYTTVALLQIPFLFYRYIIPETIPKQYYKSISSFVIAVHFALGLALAGMLQSSKIKNFLILPFSSSFDPSLALVAVGGLSPNLLAWLVQVRYAEKPKWASKFDLSTEQVDWSLFWGSVVFGAAWGWLGICPGPGIVLEGAFVEQWNIGFWILGFPMGRLLPVSFQSPF
jgi:uncharacterized protein